MDENTLRRIIRQELRFYFQAVLPEKTDDGTCTPAMEVIERVSALSGFPVSEILSDRQGKGLCRARSAAMAICVHALPYSLPKLGNVFRRDHTTIMHARRRHPERMSNDHLYRAIYEAALRATKEAA